MRKLLLLVVTLGLVACGTPAPPAPPDTSADEAKLKTDLAKWMDDFNAGNLEAVASQYANDAMLMPPNAPAATGPAAIRAALKTEFDNAKAAGLTLKSTATTGVGVSGDLAWMTGTYAAVDAKGTTVDTGKYMSIHRRSAGGWPYIRDTWNSDNPPPPPPPPAKGK
jgi:ketosteroid isomerase-like protein